MDFAAITMQVQDLAYEVFDGDTEKANDWLLEPNSYFFNNSPIEYILLGNGQAVLDSLRERLT